jgi:mono/diheme cytochrome c family protein
MEIWQLDRFFKWIVVISSIVCLIIFALLVWEEKAAAEWLQYQQEYEVLLGNVQTGKNAAQAKISKEIKQIVLNRLKRIDRCISCHSGVENPAMAKSTAPFKAHTGNYLEIHPNEKFGCTICHGGEGRILKIQEVCNPSQGTESRHSLKYIQSNCGKCHLAIFEDNLPLKGTSGLYKGLEIFRREGCLGCHKVRQVGGNIGPDLTGQGAKTKAAYNFRYLKGIATIPSWLKEHFKDPEVVSPGSSMLKFSLNQDDLEALVTFTMGLFRPDLPLEFYTFSSLREFKSRKMIQEDQQVFSLFCGACHGKKGEGKDYQDYKNGVSTLNNQDFLAVASQDLIKFTILNGRGRRQMASWAPNLSGLYPEEIQKVIRHIANWQPTPPSWEDVKQTKGDGRKGKELYRTHCQMCHGLNGQGGVAPVLNNQDFLRLVSDEFLYLILAKGRANTAMPAWSRYAANDIASLIKYIRSWQQLSGFQLPSTEIKGDIDAGQRLFDHLCIRCHGKYGSGGIGPAILNRDFLAAASDQFIFQTVANGRRHTAMFGWTRDLGEGEKLEIEKINNILAYIRAFRDSTLDVIYPGESLGKPRRGKKLYDRYCSECHGYRGEGLRAPALNIQEFLNAATNGFLLATISLGRTGTAMPSWGRGSEKYPQLTARDRIDIVAHIRTWQQMVIRRVDLNDKVSQR